MNPYRTIDLFSGAGGFTLGFHNLKHENGENLFRPVWANDFNKDAVDTYNHNFEPVCVLGDLIEILEDDSIEIPKADVVLGGPPCQGFSLLNKNRVGDPRRELWYQYMKVVELSEASVFVMENVPQLLKSGQYQEIVACAEEMGFVVTPGQTLVAADYGVPQLRKRAIIVGTKIGNPHNWFPPVKTHKNPKKGDIDLPDWLTVKHAIENLPKPKGTELRPEDGDTLRLHFGRNPSEVSKKRYRAIPDEGMNRFDLQRIAPEITPKCWINKKSGGTDLFGRLWWDRPSVTIRTEFYKPEKGRYLHPKQHRPITHREAARIQSFPDDFHFCGTKIEIARQIGNAVPPKLAENIALSVLLILTNGKGLYKENKQYSLCLED